MRKTVHYRIYSCNEKHFEIDFSPKKKGRLSLEKLFFFLNVETYFIFMPHCALTSFQMSTT